MIRVPPAAGVGVEVGVTEGVDVDGEYVIGGDTVGGGVGVGDGVVGVVVEEPCVSCRLLAIVIPQHPLK